MNNTPGPWQVGGQYGRIGVEVVTAGHSLAIVNRVQAERLDYLDKERNAKARRGERGHQEETEAQRLEASLEQALADARLIAAAPQLVSACLETLAVLASITADQFSKGGDRPAREALYGALEAAGVDFHNHPASGR